MNSTHHIGQAPEEVRVLVACDAGAFAAERGMLRLTVFPEVRRMCLGRGVVFTDIDLQHNADDPSPERLFVSCIEEIHHNGSFVICLLDEGAGEICARILGDGGAPHSDTIAERVWFYTRTAAGHDVLPRRLRGRELRLREGWGSARTLGAWVRDDLLALLEGIAPAGRLRALERERAAHEAFAASCRIGALERPELAALLDAHVEGNGPPLVILGASGAGKSTLVAQWCAAYRLRRPDAFVISHHVGASTRGGTGADVARSIIEEIRDRAGDEPAAHAEAGDPAKELPLQLARRAHQRLVLIVDGADQLADGAALEWLPRFLPSNVRLVVTSTEQPTTAVEDGWRIHRMHGLTRNERLALGTLYVDRVRSAMPGERFDHLVSVAVNDPSIATPLAFRVRLEELRLKGGRRMGNAAGFAGAADVEELMARLIAYREGEFGAAQVARLLTALAGARAGLTHRELAAYVGGADPDLVDMLTAFDLHLLRMDGRIRFHHDAFRRAVEARYLSDADERRALHSRLATLLSAEPDREEETAWHLRAAEDRERLSEYLRRLDVARAFVRAELEHELAEGWMFAADMDAMVAAYVGAVDALDPEPARERIAALLDVAAVFRRAGRVRDALPLLERAAGIAEEYLPEDARTSGAIAAQIAPLLASAGRLRASEERYRAALRVEHGGAYQSIARTLGELAGVLAATGRYAEAEGEYRSALAMLERCGAAATQLAGAVNDLATVLHECGRLAEAEALYRRALDLWASGGAETHPDAVATLSNLAALYFDRGEHAEARAVRERVVDLWQAALGPNHPYVATALTNLATQITRDDPDAALPPLERALAIHEAAFAEPTHETAVLIYSIGRVHYYAGRLGDAEHFMRRAYELQRRLLGADHVDTANTLNGLGLVLSERGDDILAEQLLKQALEIFERLLGPEHRRVARLLMNLAQLARKRDERDTARGLAQRALEILETGISGNARLHENLTGLIAELDGLRSAPS